MRIRYRLMKTSKLVVCQNLLATEILQLNSWPLKVYCEGSVLKQIINEDMRMLQDYIIPELARRGLK